MKKRIPLGLKLALLILGIFLLYALVFAAYTQRRERHFKVELLHARMQNYNAALLEFIEENDTIDEAALDEYIDRHRLDSMRVTIIDTAGCVLYDNVCKRYDCMGCHKERREVQEAMRKGQGYDTERRSNSLHREYFYSASLMHSRGLVVRTALPYDSALEHTLQADHTYLIVATSLAVLLCLLLYHFSHRLGRNITNLRLFAQAAVQNEDLNPADLLNFSHDELGEIAERIVKIHYNLRHTREEQNRMKRQLTQNVEHELKTPIASIQGYLETILSSDNMDEETKRQFLGRCYIQSQRLTALLHDISSLTRMENVVQTATFTAVDVSQLVREIQHDAALLLSEHQMTFDNRLPSGIVVQGDHSLLQSIFQNLTSNAIAYAGPGTTITLTAKETPSAWLFRFADNGVGVPEEDLPRLFERFYRVDKGRSRKTGGTGLGLAIVKNAVLLHSGEISVENDPKGGLVFQFTLPK